MKSLIKSLAIFCFVIAYPVYALSSDTVAKFPEGYHGVNLGDKWEDVRHVLTTPNTKFGKYSWPGQAHCSYRLIYKERRSPSETSVTYTFYQDKVCHILYEVKIKSSLEEGMEVCLEKYGKASKIHDKRPIYQRILITYNTPSSLNGKVAKAVIYLSHKYYSCQVSLSVYHADFARLYEQNKICSEEAHKKELKRYKEAEKARKKSLLP